LRPGKYYLPKGCLFFFLHRLFTVLLKKNDFRSSTRRTANRRACTVNVGNLLV
jgi:hypothetical protein